MSANPTPPVPPPSVPSGRSHLSPDEFRASTGLGRTLVYRLLRQKQVLSFRVGKRIFIPVEELVAFPERMKQK